MKESIRLASADKVRTIATRSLVSRTAVLGALLIIMIFGGWIRIYCISKVSPRIGDEANYLLEARYISGFIRGVWNSAQVFLDEKAQSIAIKRRVMQEIKAGRSIEDVVQQFEGEIGVTQDLWRKEEQIERIKAEMQGLPPRYARLTHVLLIAVGDLACGTSPQTGIWVSAILGTFTIPWVFALGRTLYGEKIGLIAALFFAVMGYHIYYSRSGEAESTSLFFLTPGMLYYYKSRWLAASFLNRWILLSGAFLGIGFTAHNRILPLFVLVILLEIKLYWKSIKNQPRETIFLRFFFLCLFFAAPSIVWESIYYTVMLIMKRLSLFFPHPTYVEQMIHAFGHSMLWGLVSKSFHMSGFLTFPFLFHYMCGTLSILFLFVGLVVTITRRRPVDLYLALWFLSFYCLYSLTSAGVTRFFTILLPPAAILMAIPFSVRPSARVNSHPSMHKYRRLISRIVLAIVVTHSAYVAIAHVVTNQDVIASTHDFIRTKGGEKVISTWGPFTQVYFGVDAVAYPPESHEKLKHLYEKGFRYLIVDGLIELVSFYQKDRYDVIADVVKSVAPVYDVKNPLFRHPQYLFEANLYFWDTLAILRIPDSTVERIRVYDLESYFSRVAPQL